jgi:hypothetical protein
MYKISPVIAKVFCRRLHTIASDKTEIRDVALDDAPQHDVSISFIELEGSRRR